MEVWLKIEGSRKPFESGEKGDDFSGKGRWEVDQKGGKRVSRTASMGS